MDKKRKEEYDFAKAVVLLEKMGLRKAANKLEEAKTKKHDDSPALKGGQRDLPDELQKGIIKSKSKKHDCANHVKDKKTQKEGFTLEHNWDERLQEVTKYRVDFGSGDIRIMHIDDLVVLEGRMHEHEVKEELEEKKDCPCPAGTHDGMSHTDYKKKSYGYTETASHDPLSEAVNLLSQRMGSKVTKEDLREAVKRVIAKRKKILKRRS